jgi:hypothetical protein
MFLKEHGYWINAMIQELAVYKTDLEDAPNILPPILYDSTSVSGINSSCYDQGNHDNISIRVKLNLKHEGRPNDTEESLQLEPWTTRTNDDKIPLCRTIRRLLRIASDPDENDLFYSSECSSLTNFDEEEPSATSSDEKKSFYEKNSKDEEYFDCNSDDSTVACDNTSKNKDDRNFDKLDVTMDSTSVDESPDQSPVKDLRANLDSNVLDITDLDSPTSLKCFSIVFPTTIYSRKKIATSDETSRGSSSNSSLTVSDDDSYFGQLHGRAEI